MTIAAKPFVSIAIPTHDRPHHLERCIATLVAQDYPIDRYEIVVADDGSALRTSEVVAAIAERVDAPAILYLRQQHRGVNAARNLAIRAASGDPICMVDDDQEAPPTWLSEIVRGCFEHPAAGCVGGPMRLRYDGTPPRTCGREPLGESELDLGSDAIETQHVWGGNMALRRAAFERVGPFREDLVNLGHTEIEWQDRLRAAGGHVIYVPDAWLWHVRTAEQLRLGNLVRRHFARGRGQAHNGARIGRSYSRTDTLGSLRMAIGHAASARCSVGIIDAARYAGRLVGMAEVALRRRMRSDRDA